MRLLSAAAAIAAAALLHGFAAPGIFETWTPDRTGIKWRHESGRSLRRYQPESIGPGVAMFDYNNDGWMDLYFPNSGPCDFFQPARPLRAALYRNNGNGTFTDVAASAGVSEPRMYGLGAAAADYDGDGWVDLLVTGYDHNVLYRNRGDGTFEDVTRRAGLEAAGIFTSAVWLDYDGNGTLDLFVPHFVRYSKKLEQECRTNGIYHYCYPLSYQPWPSRLYRNNGDGTFTDVSAVSGIGKHPGKAFGAVAIDIDGDGRLDIFVANDSTPNFLFRNRGDGTFEEIGLAAGVAYSADGVARSGMGVDAADYDGDGRPDLFVANFNRERFSIYRNVGRGAFSDTAGVTGIGSATYMYSGWGSRFFDFDNDGDLDLIVANGHPDDQIESVQSSLRWKEPLLLLENRGGKFVNLGAGAGEAFLRSFTARGLAIGDLDNDGWPDIVVANNDDVPVVLRNRPGENHWLGLDGVPSGAVIRWPGGKRFVAAGGSFLSSQDPRVVLGLGAQTTVEWIEIDTPSGRTRRMENLRADRYYRPSAAGSR
jgi:enediyne biosynthesis protein E4